MFNYRSIRSFAVRAAAVLAPLYAAAPAAAAVFGQPHMSVNPLAVDYQVQHLGTTSDAYWVAVENAPGGSDLHYLIELRGENASDFSTTCDAGGTACFEGWISPGFNVYVQVRFSPLFAGPRSAEIVVTGSDSTNPEDTVLLTGIGTELLFADGFENAETSEWDGCVGCPV
jgi:hypothetical protein